MIESRIWILDKRLLFAVRLTVDYETPDMTDFFRPHQLIVLTLGPISQVSDRVCHVYYTYLSLMIFRGSQREHLVCLATLYIRQRQANWPGKNVPWGQLAHFPDPSSSLPRHAGRVYCFFQWLCLCWLKCSGVRFHLRIPEKSLAPRKTIFCVSSNNSRRSNGLREYCKTREQAST